jgi:hypothetical protein
VAKHPRDGNQTLSDMVVRGVTIRPRMSTVVMDGLKNNNNDDDGGGGGNIVKPISSLQSTRMAILYFPIQPTIRRYVILTELETVGTCEMINFSLQVPANTYEP